MPVPSVRASGIAQLLGAAREGQESALPTLLQRTMHACEGETDCQRYRFARDLDETSAFHLVELREDEAALKAHAAGDAFRAFLAELPSVGTITRSKARIGNLEPCRFARPKT